MRWTLILNRGMSEMKRIPFVFLEMRALLPVGSLTNSPLREQCLGLLSVVSVPTEQYWMYSEVPSLWPTGTPWPFTLSDMRDGGGLTRAHAVLLRRGMPPKDFDSLIEFLRKFTFKTGRGEVPVSLLLFSPLWKMRLVLLVTFTLRRRWAFTSDLRPPLGSS